MTLDDVYGAKAERLRHQVRSHTENGRCAIALADGVNGIFTI